LNRIEYLYFPVDLSDKMAYTLNPSPTDPNCQYRMPGHPAIFLLGLLENHSAMIAAMKAGLLPGQRAIERNPNYRGVKRQ